MLNSKRKNGAKHFNMGSLESALGIQHLAPEHLRKNTKQYSAPPLLLFSLAIHSPPSHLVSHSTKCFLTECRMLTAIHAGVPARDQAWPHAMRDRVRPPGSRPQRSP